MTGASKTSPAAQTGGGTSMPLRGLAVLIAEDEYLLASDIARELERQGASTVGPFATADRAMAAMTGTATLDAAILDVNLRGTAVYPLADLLIELGTPFVFMTGYAGEALPSRLSGVPCCYKPLRARTAVDLLAKRVAQPVGSPNAPR